MKSRVKVSVLIIVSVIYIFISGFSLPNDKQSFTLKLLKTHYAHGLYLVKNFLKNPVHSLNIWLMRAKHKYKLLNLIPIAVHETCHFHNKIGKATGKERAVGQTSGEQNTISVPAGRKHYVTRIIKVTFVPNSMGKKKFKKIVDGLEQKKDREFLNKAYKKSAFTWVTLTKKDKATKRKILKIFKRSDYYKPKKYIKNPDGSLTPVEKYNNVKTMKIYIDNNTVYTFPLTKTFITNEIAKQIPAHLSKFRFSRYNIYINTQVPNIGTQMEGVYGLFDEYTAFYYGTKTALNLVDYYKNDLPQIANTWRWYFKTVNWHYWSYYDFKYYIYRYVLHARKYYPGIYKKIMSNKEFIKAFRAMTRKWEKLIADYNATKKRIYAYLRTKGIRVYEGPKYSVVTKGRKRYGILSFNFIVKRLKAELRKSIYKNVL